MADALHAIEKLLETSNATLKRNKNNLVYSIPGVDKPFTMPRRELNGRASKNALSELRRLLKNVTPANPSTMKSALRKVGIRSTTQKRIDSFTENLARKAKPSYISAVTPDPTVEKVLGKIQLENIARNMTADVLSPAAVENVLQGWSRSMPLKKRPHHSKDAPPCKQASHEEIEAANVILKAQQAAEPKKEAWVPPVPIKRVGDEMIVLSPSITFKPTKPQEDWMNTASLDAHIQQWKEEAAAKRSRADQLIEEASRLGEDAKQLDVAAASAAAFVESLKTNSELLLKKPDGSNGPRKLATPITRTELAGHIIKILDEAGAPQGTGELRRKLRDMVSRDVDYGAIYNAMNAVTDKITKTSLGYWFKDRAIPGYANAPSPQMSATA